LENLSLCLRDGPLELSILFEGNFQRPLQSFRPGGVLGKSASELGCEVAIAALAKYAESAMELLPRLRRRLAWSRRFDLVAKFAAACGSGGTIAALSAGSYGSKAVIAAAVALTGSICSLVFAYLQRDESAGSISEAYNRLIIALVQAASLQRILPDLCRLGASPQLKDAISKANDIARTLNELTLRFK
jgi:hypothetical protein